MADILSNQVEYTPLSAPELYKKALKKCNILDYFTVIPNAKPNQTVVLDKFYGLEDDILRASGRDCDWNPAEGQVVSSKEVVAKAWVAQFEQCLSKLDTLRAKALYNAEDGINGDIDKIEDVMAEDVLRNIGVSLGNIALGSTADSLVTKLLADGDSIKVSKTTITKQNVLEEIEKVVDAIPDKVISEAFYDQDRAGVQVFIPISVFRMLRTVAGSAPTSTNVLLPSLTFDGTSYFYNDVKLVPVSTMPDNTMLAFNKANVFAITNLLSETTTLTVERGKSVKDKNMLYGSAEFVTTFDYIFGDEIVIYA